MLAGSRRVEPARRRSAGAEDRRGFSQSRLAAWLQDIVSRRRQESGLCGEIAAKLPLPERGRVLDIGTGSGLQLSAIYELRPEVELHSLDLSDTAIRVARRSRFGASASVEQVTLQDLPILAQITLHRPALPGGEC